MPKEILFYQPIYDDSVAAFIGSMEDAKNEDVTIRVNTPGGSVYAGYGMFAKFAEHTKGKLVKVDGRAFSGGAFFACYADDVECLDVSEFLFHRAALPDWFENDPKLFTDDMKASLAKMNEGLKGAMTAKVDSAKFQAVTGKTIDELFSMDSRLDVRLSAAQAKEIGLVNRITPITPVKKAEINAYYASFGMAAFYPEAETRSIITKTEHKMTLAELKLQHPEAFAAAQTEAVTNERDRVNAWMAYVDLDPEAVAAGIKEGKEITRTVQAEMARKEFSKERIAAIVADNPAAIATPEAEANATAADKELADFTAEVRKGAGLKTV